MSGAIRRSLATGLCATLLPLGVLAAPANEHVFAPGDEIDVSVLTAPDSLTGYSRQIVLSEEGTITLPHVGRIAVVGRTASQILPDLERQYRKLYAYAFVGMQLLRTKPLEPPQSDAVYLMGQVRNPGAVTPAQSGKHLTLADLIGRAGGTTEQADLANVTIFRRQGTVETVNFDLALRDGSAARVELYPGDTVRVPGNWLASFTTYAPIVQTAIGVFGVVAVLVSFFNNQRPQTTSAP